MVSRNSDSAQSGGTPPEFPAGSAKANVNWTADIDSDQAFRLIDSILPFEACLYHQVLPLALEGSRLKLGMVNLEDTAALDYVRRILAFMNCSLVPQTLASEVHHAVLTAYLNYSGSRTQSSKRPSNRPPAQTSTPSSDPPHGNVSTPAPTREPSTKAHLDSDQAARPTLLVDSPAELLEKEMIPRAPDILPEPEPNGTVDSFLEAHQTSIQPLPSTQEAELTPVPAQAVAKQPDLPPPVQPAEAAALKETLLLAEEAIPPPELPSQIRVPGESLPVLQVEATHLSDPVEQLANLSPANLLSELMARLLLGGIGRLYLERQADHGRILWSQNGVLQSVLENLSLNQLQGMINELKRLTHLPLLPVQEAKQAEIERLYQKQRLLLRLRVMPGNFGEEATLQVLRGAALKFYQQQQLSTLSRDALGIAQELQQKVNEIRNRTRFYPMVTPDQLSILPALNQVVKSVEQQLAALKEVQLQLELEKEALQHTDP